jgi:large subunit ribosomal protein L10
MPTPEKENIVQELSRLFQENPGIYLTDFTGLNVEELGVLRRKCRRKAVSYRVVKNRLARLAVVGTPAEPMLPFLTGPTAIAVCPEDPVTPARVLKEFVDEYQRPTIKAGLIEGRLVEAEQVWRIAELPAREVLLAQFMGGLQSPLRNLIWAMKGVTQGLARVLAQVRDQKESQEGQQA